jgi:hypothetical protein
LGRLQPSEDVADRCSLPVDAVSHLVEIRAPGYDRDSQRSD